MLALHRSVDAVAIKAKRTGLPVPPRKKSLAKTGENKVTKSVATTTTKPIKLKPVKFKELPSPNIAMGYLWAAVKRLQQPDVSPQEVKKLRLIISAVKSYIHLHADYVLRIRQIEQRMLTMYKTEARHLQVLADHAENSEEKSRLETEIEKLQQQIAEMEEMG